jgi:hypothetical protein
MDVACPRWPDGRSGSRDALPGEADGAHGGCCRYYQLRCAASASSDAARPVIRAGLAVIRLITQRQPAAPYDVSATTFRSDILIVMLVTAARLNQSPRQRKRHRRHGR